MESPLVDVERNPHRRTKIVIEQQRFKLIIFERLFSTNLTEYPRLPTIPLIKIKHHAKRASLDDGHRWLEGMVLGLTVI